MRLLLISASTQRGGVEEYALTIASAAEKSWEVHAAFPEEDSTASLIQSFQQSGVRYHPLNILETKIYPIRALDHLSNFLLTLVLLLKVKPDVVQINLPWFNGCFNSILACGFLQIPTVVVFHLFPEQVSIPTLKLKLYAWARSRNQQWIGVSEHNRKQIIDSFHVTEEEVLCIYNGAKLTVDSSQVQDRVNQRQQIRRDLGLSPTTQIALTVGRLSHQKGYTDLIPVITQLKTEFPDVKFVWVGDGDQREELIRQIQAHQIEHKVLLLGYRSDVPALLKASDLFVFPTRFEGQPFAVIEAMACGLPIVSSDACGIPELISDKVHGLLFPTGDRDRLLESLRWTLRHPKEMEEMARNAIQRAQNFSEENMLSKTLDLLQSLSLR